jgi:hypothetical protein
MNLPAIGEVASRREFLRGSARYGLLTALVMAAAALGSRQSNVSINSRVCSSHGLCGGCSRLDGCGLPQAFAFKRVPGG